MTQTTQPATERQKASSTGTDAETDDGQQDSAELSAPTQPQAQTSNPARTVPTRRMSFEESMRDLPRHFAGDGDLISGHLIAALSSVFPDGEDYFVRSVRYFRDQVTDPALKRQVAGFIGQAGAHG